MVDIHFVDVDKLNLSYIENWLKKAFTKEGKSFSQLTFVFGTDDWLLKYNQDFLNHNYYTDVITFEYSENNIISGDILISLERVYDNAKVNNVSRETEINRVIIHGCLHLMGYNDKTPEEKIIMRKKEDFYLSML